MSCKSSAGLVGVFWFLCAFSVFAHEDEFGREHPEWKFTGEQAGIVYLVDHDEPRIERFDLNQSTWLEPLVPPAIPTAFTLDSEGIVIATERALYEADIGATEFYFIGNAVNSVIDMASEGTTLHLSLNGQPSYEVRNRNDGTLVERRDFFYEMVGMVYSPLSDTWLGRKSNTTPGDIVALDLNEPDDFLAQTDSPHHGDYPDASRLWLLPDQRRVLDDAGLIYSVPDLNWIGSAAGKVEDVVFIDNSSFGVQN